MSTLETKLSNNPEVYRPYVEAAFQQATAQLEIDANPGIRTTDGGVWVAAWVWVADEELPEPIKEKKAIEAGMVAGFARTEQFYRDHGAELGITRDALRDMQDHQGDVAPFYDVDHRADPWSIRAKPEDVTESPALFKCAHPQCPGYPYKASDIRHPCDFPGDPPMPHVIVCGNPCDGFEFIGTFPTGEEANDYADQWLSNRDWWVTLLQAPAPAAEPNEDMDGDHASALASAGMGTDEDYGYYGPDDEGPF